VFSENSSEDIFIHKV